MNIYNMVSRFFISFQDPVWLRRAGMLAIVAALFLRVAWGIMIPVIPVSDSNAYDVFAQNIALGHGYCWKPGELTAYWAVGTSALYALLYGMFGHDYMPIIILNILVGVGTIMLAMSLARRWLGDIPSVLTGWILALWPLLIQYTTILASELLFIFCILATFWLASMPSWKWFPRSVAAGVGLAAASYIRPVALLMAPLVFLYEASVHQRLARAIVACIISSIIMILLILPWSMRNQSVFDRFVLISTNAGSNFWMGNNPETTGDYMPLPHVDITNEVDRDHYFKSQAWNYIRQYPMEFVARTIKKFILLHERESIGINWNQKGLVEKFGPNILLPLKLMSSFYWWLTLVFAVLGSILFINQKGWKETLSVPILTTWLYFTFVHAITVIGDRYHMPSIPFVAMLAAYGLGVIVRAGYPVDHNSEQLVHKIVNTDELNKV